MWRIQSGTGRTQSLAEWEIQTEATQRLTLARDTLIARIEGKPSPSSRRRSSCSTGERQPAKCGSTPAMMLTFHQQIGMLFRRKTMTLKAGLCRDYSLTIGRQTQNKTLTTAAWGIISFFKNIGFIASNAGALSTASHLPAPQPPPNPEDFKRPRSPHAGSQRDAPAGRARLDRRRGLHGLHGGVVDPRDTHSSSSWKVNTCVEQNPNNPIQVRRSRARKRTSASSRPWS